MLTPSLDIAIAGLCALASAAPAPAPLVSEVRSFFDSAYTPITTTCPSTDLVRPAAGLNANEAKYIAARKPKANAGLSSWLKGRGSFNTSRLPTVAFTSSGGGYRAMLSSGGVVQGLDARDSNVGTSGVYQGLTYHAGLSGGSWFLSSLSANDWPTITSLKTTLWEPALEHSLILPANLSLSGAKEDALVADDIKRKEDAGFQTTVIDAWGRLLSYQLLHGTDGGAADRISGLTSLSNFTDHNVPYSIITALGVQANKGQCFPDINSTQYEFHAFEYGSWDAGVSAFAQSKFMGTSMMNGKPSNYKECTVHYDNIGYIFGTSSNVFSAVCDVILPSNSTDDLAGLLEGFVAAAHPPVFDDQFGLYPNPFRQYPRSALVQDQKLLTLVDGGEGGQNNPIWPFIAGSRSADVLIVNDNSADTDDNFPNGTEIRQTFLNARADGHARMPFIPDVATFVAQGLNKRATFFGCNETGTSFIVYLPNVNYTFPSNEPTSKLQYSKAETDGMVANGVEIATQNGDEMWPFCLACAVKNADGNKLPKGCDACFQKYCFHRR